MINYQSWWRLNTRVNGWKSTPWHCNMKQYVNTALVCVHAGWRWVVLLTMSSCTTSFGESCIWLATVIKPEPGRYLQCLLLTCLSVLSFSSCRPFSTCPASTPPTSKPTTSWNDRSGALPSQSCSTSCYSQSLCFCVPCQSAATFILCFT